MTIARKHLVYRDNINVLFQWKKTLCALAGEAMLHPTAACLNSSMAWIDYALQAVEQPVCALSR